MIDSISFEESVDEVKSLIQRRKHAWALISYLEWEEVAQLLLVRVWQKWHLYQPEKGPLENWTNRLITNTLFNLKRDLLDKHARPCIGGGNANGKMCVHNLGGDACAYTRSKKQCAQCPLYAAWQKSKEPLHNIKASLALEHHAQEVNNIQSDFMDIDGAKQTIDKKMLSRLGSWNKRVYRLLYIEHLTPIQASEKLKEIAAARKRPLKPTDPVEYQLVLRASKDMKNMIKEIIEEEDLI